MIDAHVRVRQAVASGELVPGPCEECGSVQAVAHHDDYARPLDVRWLCRGCHGRWHSESRAANRESGSVMIRAAVSQHVSDLLAKIAAEKSCSKRAALEVAIEQLAKRLGVAT